MIRATHCMHEIEHLIVTCCMRSGFYSVSLERSRGAPATLVERGDESCGSCRSDAFTLLSSSS